MQKIKFEELERHELERMKCNTFKVSDELTRKIGDASILNRFTKSRNSLPK